MGTFSQQFEGVEIQPGWNKLELMAANRFDFIGFAEKSFEATPIPPEDADLEISLTTVGRNDDETIFANFMITRPTGEPEPFSGAFTKTPTGSYHDPVLNATIVLEPDGSVFDPEHQLLITFSFPDEILSNVSVLLNNSAGDPFHYGGERVVTEDDRLDWAGHEFDLTAESFITASTGGDYDPFFIEWLGPATLAQSLQDMKITSFFLNPDGTPANVERTFDLATIEGRRLLSFSGSDFATPIIGTTTLLEQLAPQSGPKRMGVWNFTKGFGTGLCDTGVSLYDGVATLGKGGWYIAKNYNSLLISYRFLSGQDVILEQDQKRISMAWGTVTQIAEIAWKLHQFNQEVTDAVLAGDQEELNELGEQYRVAAETAQFLLDTAIDELQNLDDYEFGKLCGRITGEIVVQAGTALLSAGVGTVLRDSELMTSIITKIGTLSDTVIPAAAKAKLLALLEPGGFLARMASTKMCFVAGTPIHTPSGLVPIEQVKPGDLVLSRDPKRGDQGFKAVLQTFVTHPETLYRVEYAAGHGNAGRAAEDSAPRKTATLIGTGQHPFYVENAAAFVPVSELRVGDRLRLADGSAAHVTDVCIERGPPASAFSSDGTLTTYNFEVADWHTYFVGEEGVWVHNVGDICQKAFSIFRRHVDDLGESPETAFKSVETILTKYMTENGFTHKQRLKHLGDVLDGVVKEVRNLDEGASLWTSQKKLVSAQNMWDHWIRHGGEFPEFENAVQYVNGALDFVESPTPTMKVGLRLGENSLGEVVLEKVFMDPGNGRFAVRVLDGAEAGALKTFFRIDGTAEDWMIYWGKQNILEVIQ